MRTIVMIAQEILAAVREQGAAIQALIIVSSQDSMAANEEIKARLRLIEQAVAEEPAARLVLTLGSPVQNP
jgi:hypothetical protein